MIKKFKAIIFRVRKFGVLSTLLPVSANRLALFLYRISNFLYRIKIPELPFLFYYLNALIHGCEIHYMAKIGKKFIISHSRGVVIGSKVIMGDNVRVHSGVIIGKKDMSSGMPVVGDNVYIGAGAALMGSIKIGNHVVIGANSVVIHDVPDNVVVAGSPAKIIKKLV